MQKWLKIILVVVFLSLFAYSTFAALGAGWDAVSACPAGSPFCINTTAFPLNGTVNLDGQSSGTFDWDITANTKGAYLFRFAVNRSGNSTLYNSGSVNVTIFQKNRIIPLRADMVPGDPFSVNASAFISCNLSGASSCIVDLEIVADPNVPVGSNWTFFFITNRTGNLSTYESGKIIITITSDVGIVCSYSEDTVILGTTLICDDFVIENNAVVTFINSQLFANRSIIHDGSKRVMKNSNKSIT